MVTGSISLANNLKVQPFVIALTLVAFGTSAPELAISVNSAIKGYQGITIGNIVGSNIANVLFALPLAFLIKIPKKSVIKKTDCIFLIVATIFFSYVFIKIKSFGVFTGIIMLLMLAIYIIFIIVEALKGKREFDAEDIAVNYNLRKSILFSIIGLVGILIGSEILVKGAILTANFLGISQAIIGLTIVAIGTSIPEVVTSIVAAIRGQTNFILGAILGSNLFNLLAITGVASTITLLSTSNLLSNIDIFYLFYSTIAFVLIATFLNLLNKKCVLVMLISYLIYVLFIYI